MNNLLPDGGEQGSFLGLTFQYLTTFQNLILVLANLLQVKYENSSYFPFETYSIIMSLFIEAECVYFLALMELFSLIPNASYHRATSLICYVSGILACTYLLLIIFPATSWIILSLFSMGILPDSYPQITKLINGISVGLYNMYNSLQQYFNPNNVQIESSSQAINGNSMDQDDGGGVPTKQMNGGV